MCTCGAEAGEVTGTVEGETMFHASLSREEYERVLEVERLRVEAFVREDPECDFYTVLLARRAGADQSPV